MAKHKQPKAWEGKDMVEEPLKDGYGIERLMPGFRVWRGATPIARVGFYTDAIAQVAVDREARRAYRKS